MKKIYLLILSLACLSSSIVFAASPCDSEQNYQRMTQSYSSQNQRQCQTPCQKHYHKKTMPCQKSVMSCEKPCQKQVAPCHKPVDSCQKPCDVQPSYPKSTLNDCFLCTNRSMNSLFSCMNLSDTQICTAMKIQDKYALEVLSLNEKIQCEEQKLAQLNANCAKKSDIRKQKRYIKKLKKERKKICKCYEDQFKTLLSHDQKKAYKKAKK